MVGGCILALMLLLMVLAPHVGMVLYNCSSLEYHYHIAGKFGRQKIWRIVLEVEKIKFGEILIWRIPADVLSRIHKHAHISMRFWPLVT